MNLGAHPKFAAIILWLALIAPSICHADQVTLKKLLRPAQDGLSVMDLEASQEIFGHNSKSPLKPASVLKVLVSIVALEELGPEFTIPTELFVDRLDNGNVHNLYVRGGGDPGFVPESSYLLARKLKRSGIRSIDKLILDDSLFVDPPRRGGQRAYQTAPSALSFNYNSLLFEICPTEASKAAKVAVDPWEMQVKLNGTIKTVTGRLDRTEVLEDAKGQYSVSGTIGESQRCDLIYRSASDPARLFGSVFSSQLKQIGIQFKGIQEKGETPGTATLIYEHQSQPLLRIVEDLNHFSNNFIAEQLLYLMGETNSGRFDRRLGLQRLATFLLKRGVPRSEFELDDASGLSHENRISAAAVSKLLAYAAAAPAIGPEFLASLSVASRSGTLEKRVFDTAGAVFRAKTGTIDGVSSLAGYVRAKSGRELAFCLLLNGVKSLDDGRQAEERIVKEIVQSF